jgi:hypothetical protein
MSSPNLGTIVIVNQGGGVYFPAVVTITHDSWTESMDEGDYALTQPGEGEVYVFLFANNGNTDLVGPCTEGTGTGQYSLPNYQTQAV